VTPAPRSIGRGAERRSTGGRAFVAGAGVVALLVAAPIVSVAASLFAPASPNLRHLAETVLGEVVFNTVGLLVLVGAGTVAIGVATAWLVTACRFPGSRAFEWLLLLPLAMPAYIIGYAYTDWLSFAGPVQTALRGAFGLTRADYWFPEPHGLPGVSAMLTLVLYPYVYLLARTAFLEQSGCAVEAARTLGRGPWTAFFSVALPLARPAIAAGAALAMMEALADFGTVQYFGIHTFTTTIYRSWFGMGDRIAATQLATGLLAFVLVLVAAERLSRGGSRYHRTSRRSHAMHPYALGGWRAAAAFTACALPVALGFAVPVAILASLHGQGGDPFFGARFLGFAWNSFVLAAAGAVLVVAVAMVLAYAVRLSDRPSTQLFVRAATMGYAVPGTIIAVGVLVPLGVFDNAVDAAFRQAFGVSTGLLLSGTVVALLFAYLVRFLAVAHGALDAGLLKIPRSVDDVARTLGSSVGTMARRIHLPLLNRSVLTAAIVVFVDVLKELPATLIVRPFNFDTLAVRVYQLASDERLVQASTAALVIVAIGLLPVIVLTRMITQGRREAEGVRAAAPAE